MKKILTYCLRAIVLPFMTIAVPAAGQTTGSINTNISFNGTPRQVSLFIPPNYTSGSPARLMICLHGLGDNSANYRNSLVNALSFPVLFPNTIFVCPDGGNDQARDFYSPAGDEAFIDTTISWVMANYQIDQSQILLQGFSLGGRSALRYGLDHSGLFKGLLLNTPAVQGVKDALKPASAGGFNYAQATMPIYVTHGSNDLFYTGPIDTMLYQLVLHDAPVHLNRISGMGHLVPQPAQMPELPTYFDTATLHSYDVDLYTARTPERACQAQFSLELLVRNTGVQPVTSLQLQYQLNGSWQSYNWTGALTSYQHAWITIPNLTANAGKQQITAKIVSINGGIPDTVSANNQQQTSFEYVATPVSLPLSEGFESQQVPPAGWLRHTSGDGYSAWDVDNTVSKTGQASIFAFNTALIFDNRGRREELYSPVMDLSGSTQPRLSFDLSSNYHLFTPPYVNDTTVFADTLEVAVSTDCGASYQVVYKKAGADLATYVSPILNPISLQAADQIPTANDWRHDTVSLNNFVASSEAIVRISYISGIGGWINLDNVQVSDATLAVPEVASLAGLRLFPNPATGIVTIESETNIDRIWIADISGKIVDRIDGNSIWRMQIDVSKYQEGLYLLKVQTGDSIKSMKLLVRK